MLLAGGVIMGLAWACAMQGLPCCRSAWTGAGRAKPSPWPWRCRTDLGVAQPFTGMIADRHGSAKVIAAGLVFYALGLIGMTLAATPAMFVLTAGICVGIALSGTAFAVIYGALNGRA